MSEAAEETSGTAWVRPPGWTGLLGAPLLLALGVWVGVLLYERPEPVMDTSAAGFSAGRMQTYLPYVALEPRPVGSEHHDAVRAWLVAEIKALGLAPMLQAGARGGHMLTNVVTRLPGRDNTGAILLASHYDTKPVTPGAADDGVSVLVLLDILSRLVREPALRNDLIFLFTDGEEIDLLGARLFSEEHPWMEDVAAVLNFDNIGNDGPIVMFQTGRESGALVARYAAVVEHPVTSSFAPAVYEALPNDTDFTPFLELGLPGLNFAVVGGGDAYHQPSDTHDALDRGTAQLLGNTALAMARDLGDLDVSMLPRDERTYFDVLNRRVIVYPLGISLMVIGFSVLMLGLAFLVGVRRYELGTADVLKGFVLCVAYLFGAALVCVGAWIAVDRISEALVSPRHHPDSNLNSTSWTMGGLAGLAFVTVTSAIELFRRGEKETLAGSFVLASLALWAAPLLLLVLVRPTSGAQIPVALALVSCTSLFARGSFGKLVCLVGAVCAVVLIAPVLVLIVHLLSKQLIESIVVGSVLLTFSMGLLTPYLGAVSHPAVLRILLFLASIGALAYGSILRIQGV